MSCSIQRRPSFLLPLPIEGIGTERVEGFASFLARLATAHGMPAKPLLRLLELRFRPKETHFTPLSNHYPRKWNGLRVDLAIDLLVEGLGRKEVFCTTFHSLRSVAEPQSLQQMHRKWCSACYAEQVTPYDCLIWNCPLTYRCAIHQIALDGLCPQCEKKQITYSVRGVDICIHCRESLVRAPGTYRRAKAPGVGERELLKILRASATNPLYVYPEDAIERYWKARRNLFSDADNWTEKMQTCGSRRLVLAVLLKLSFDARCGLHELLSDPEHTAAHADHLLSAGFE